MSEKPKKAYETSDARTQLIFWFFSGLFILLVAALLLMAGLLGFFKKYRAQDRVVATGVEQELELPPEPRLQVEPEIDLQQLKAKQDSLLNSYGWVSKEAGIARIPISEAMAIMLKRGFPVRPEEVESTK